MKCPITGVNVCRFLLATVGVFVFVFLFDWVWHGKVMMDQYLATAHLWRPHAEMEAFFPFCLAMHLAMALVITFIFTRNYEKKGVMEGFRFGAMLGVLFAVFSLHSYLWLPVADMSIPLGWAVGELIKFTGAGVIASLLYRDCCGSCKVKSE